MSKWIAFNIFKNLLQTQTITELIHLYFCFSQVLNSNGFTLDTTDFIDLLEDDDDLDYSKTVKLNNEEMLRLLNLEDGNDDINKEPENASFIGIAFDALKPKMKSVYGDGEVDNLNYLHLK